MTVDPDSIWTKIAAAIGFIAFSALIIIDILGAAREVGGL